MKYFRSLTEATETGENQYIFMAQTSEKYNYLVTVLLNQ